MKSMKKVTHCSLNHLLPQEENPLKKSLFLWKLKKIKTLVVILLFVLIVIWWNALLKPCRNTSNANIQPLLSLFAKSVFAYFTERFYTNVMWKPVPERRKIDPFLPPMNIFELIIIIFWNAKLFSLNFPLNIKWIH